MSKPKRQKKNEGKKVAPAPSFALKKATLVLKPRNIRKIIFILELDLKTMALDVMCNTSMA